MSENDSSKMIDPSADDPATTIGARLVARNVPSPGDMGSLRVWSAADASMFATSDGPVGEAPEGSSNRREANTEHAAYEMHSLIGRGGMGEVYAATQTSLGRTVAVKRIARHRTASGDDETLRAAIAAFHCEAIIAGGLEHPNIVPIHDLGLDELGMPLLAMKLVEGSSWDQTLMLDLESQDPAVVIAIHVPILVAVAQAVAFAHSRDIIHRDIKPAQVLVGEYGEVLLADWGLAIHAPQKTGDRVASPRQDVPSRDSASSPAGTPVMMAPEQTEPSAKNLGTWTDIFLLGGTLYYILTGRYPHDASSRAAAMERARLGQVVPPSKRCPDRMIPPELEDLAMECLRPKPSDRLGSASEFVRRLQGFLSGETRRRESILLTRAVESEGDIPSGDYQAFGERVATLERALTLWSGNRDAERLRSQAIEGYAEAALAHSDFTLARAMANRLEQGARRDEIIAQANAAEDLLRSQLQSRRVAIAAAFILMFVVLVGGAYSFQTIRHERDAEEASRKLAETKRAEAERNLQIAKEQGDGANELVLFVLNELKSKLDEYLTPERGISPEAANEVSHGVSRAVVKRMADYYAALDSTTWPREMQAEHAARLGIVADRFVNLNFGEEALALVETELPILKAAYGEVSEKYAAALILKAMSQDILQPQSQDLSVHRKVLEISEKLLGSDSPELANAQRLLGRALARIGQYGESIPLLRKALEVDRSTNSGYEFMTLTALAESLYMGGFEEEGTLVAEQAVAACRAAGERGKFIHAMSLRMLAHAYTTQGRFEEAMAILDESLALTEKLFGPEHHNVASVLNSISYVEFRQGNLDTAIERTERALGIMARSLGPEHPNVVTLKGNLAMMMEDVPERAEEARMMMREVADLRMRDAGPDNPATWVSFQNVAASYEEIGDLDEAHKLYVQIYEARKRILPPGHPHVGTSRSNLAGCLLRLAVRESNADNAEATKGYAENILALYADDPRALDTDPSLSLFRAEAYRILERPDEGKEFMAAMIELNAFEKIPTRLQPLYEELLEEYGLARKSE